MYILAGDDISKISSTVNSSIKKYEFQPINYSLTEENFSEIVGSLETPSLFGERLLGIVDISECEFELVEKFISQTKDIKDLYLLYQNKLDSRTKLAKLLISNKALIFDEEKGPSSFAFGDYVVQKNIKASYQELEKLKKAGEEEVAIMSGITTAFRNIVNLKFKTNSSKSIFPSKLEMYKKAANLLTEEDVIKIHNTLTQNEVKFKTGQISDEMLVLHSMNFILNYSKIE